MNFGVHILRQMEDQFVELFNTVKTAVLVGFNSPLCLFAGMSKADYLKKETVNILVDLSWSLKQLKNTVSLIA